MNASALTRVYEQSRQQLLAVASRYDGQDAEDLVQDAFVSALVHRDGFRHDAAPSTWLHRIVVNACISRQRTHQAHVRLQLAQPNQSRIASARCDQAFALRRALQRLRRPDYRVFVLYELMGCTHPEIAERLSIPLGTSKWRLTMARRVLKDTLIGE